VATGDTVLGLAERFGINADTILWANDLEENADDLQVGRELTILPVSGVVHEAELGDSLLEIASMYGVDASSVAQANGLTDPDAIIVGQRLVVPGGKPPVGPRQPQGQLELRSERRQIAGAVSAADSAKDKSIADSAQGEEIVAIASDFAGYAYTWGGHVPATGFDCTGFTWYIYGQVGLTIPLHDLWGQLGAGPRIRQSELLPGDLVFFENTYQPGLSHAGVYIGNRQFIHAASERTGVRYDSLDDSYWGPRYFGASRPW
jgi:cell wall-associated NlpC family hydrolase